MSDRAVRTVRQRGTRVLPALLLLLGLAVSSCRSTDTDVRYEVVFRGNTSVGRATLDDVIVDNLVDFERHGFRESAIDDAAFAVEDYYRSEGWRNATVEHDLQEPGPGQLRAVILVDEGVRTELGEITFRGATVLRASELRAIVEGPSRGLFDQTRWYVESDVRAAASEIARAYVGRGYLRAAVSPPEVTFRDGGTVADLVYDVSEGALFHLSRIDIEGETVFTREEILGMLPCEVGDPYVPNTERQARSALAEAYGKRGHADARATIARSVDEESGDVALTITVAAGPRVTVTEVRVEGNERTRESFVLERVEAEIGKPFPPESERAAFRRLFSTGIFTRIAFDLEGTGEKRPLVVQVEEALAQEFFVEPGWGSYELGRLKAGYRNRNVFGTGRSFRTEGIASFRHLELEVGVGDPFVFGTDVYADVSFNTLRREEPSFVRISSGLDVDMARALGKSFEVGFSYQLRYSAAENVDVNDPAALAALNDVDISAIEGSLRHDSRDSVLVPTRGHSARIALQWGDRVLGSELDFLRARYRQSLFVPLGSETGDTVLGFSLRAGVIVPTHDTDQIPIQELFFNGGENTVRSFQQDELGPVDTGGEPLGGEAFTVFSTELRQKLLGNLSGALFFDYGNVVENHEDFLDFDGLRPAVGVGVRYLLPIGPLRLDLGWNPAASGLEDDWALHFSVGMPF